MPAIRGVSYYSDGAILLDGITVPFAILGPGDLGMSGQPDSRQRRRHPRLHRDLCEDRRGLADLRPPIGVRCEGAEQPTAPPRRAL
jgi:hypothetical protein